MKTKFLTASALLLLLLQSVSSMSVYCNDCDVNDCTCSTECSSGLMTVYLEKCQGIPKYELSVIGGAVKWKPPMKGLYYSQLVCDNGENSNCDQITVPTKITEQSPSGDYFIYFVLLAFLLMLVLLIYRYFK